LLDLYVHRLLGTFHMWRWWSVVSFFWLFLLSCCSWMEGTRVCCASGLKNGLQIHDWGFGPPTYCLNNRLEISSSGEVIDMWHFRRRLCIQEEYPHTHRRAILEDVSFASSASADNGIFLGMRFFTSLLAFSCLVCFERLPLSVGAVPIN
jgi:hypothetical protein